MTILSVLPLSSFDIRSTGATVFPIVRRFGSVYGAFHPPSRKAPIGAGPMLEPSHYAEWTYARGRGSRLAHLLQTCLQTMMAEGSRRSPTAQLLASFLRDGIDVRVRLSGWSMKPLVPSGSLVRFSPSGKLSLGDVVLARLPNDALLAHRIVAIDGDRIWTKGDACRAADGPISRASVIGRAVSREGFVSLPLSNVWMRAVGLIVSHLYPRLVAGYRVLLSREESAT